MKKIIFVLLCLTAVLFCGCDAKPKPKTHSENNTTSAVIVHYPIDDSVNGYRNSSSKKHNASAVENHMQALFYADASTKKFHREDCSYAKEIDEDNMELFDERQEALDQGYEPCPYCNP